MPVMLPRLIRIITLTVVVILTTLPAFAAQCGGQDEVAKALADQFGEVVQAQGITADGRLLQVWANPKTGSWTVTMSTPGGILCLVTAGERFQIAKPGEPA